MQEIRFYHINIVFLLVCFIIMPGFQCNECDEYIDNISKFKISIEPIKKNYQRTDTIWISATFSSQLVIENSSETYDNSNQGADIDFYLYHIEENNKEITRGLNDFNYYSLSGEFIKREFNDKSYQVEGRIDFNCSETECNFKIGILCHNPGIYAFGIWGGRFGYYDDPDCIYNAFEVSFDIEQNNFEICQEINTDKLFVKKPYSGRRILGNPESSNSLYFFKVEI